MHESVDAPTARDAYFHLLSPQYTRTLAMHRAEYGDML
jgi:hypothetical protein